MTVFQQMGDLDAQHRADMGFDSRSRLTGRTADLSAAIMPLARIKADLRSRYLVKGWLDRGAFSVVYGQSNVGKTFFAMDLALHIAAGEDWHGSRVPTDDKFAGPVLYVAAEGGRGIRSRIEAMRRHNPDLMGRIEAGGHLSILSAPLDLCTAEDAKYLVEAIREGFKAMPALIVIDTLARVMGSGDENSAKDMGQLVRSVDDIRAATGAHVMVVHHSGKDESKGARGSGSLRAAADTEIELTRNDGIVQAEARKQRDLPCDSVFAYSLKLVHIGFDEDGDQVASAVVVPAEPVAKKVRLTGTDKIALQALDDCVRDHGQKMSSDNYPRNRRCISLEKWREYCDRHSLSSGESDSAKRVAFHKVKNRLQEKEVVRIIDGWLWKVAPDDAPLPALPTVTKETVNASESGQSSVTGVTSPLKGGNAVTETPPVNEVTTSDRDRYQESDPVTVTPSPQREPQRFTDEAISTGAQSAADDFEAMNDPNNSEAWQ
ncbi:helicase RepA family protein [Paracoccus marinaquae]|uniref:Helicase RepA family protein n=1 Tax=Paracoccus marinaquae TaxID=2841926 RepID=A0ABS6AH00_9RHOB|nr:helicase RepA family protein [Paracoccus marinaquae]MBU3028960.1 helicase RepA family protein [Paracoccus marinaquae]